LQTKEGKRSIFSYSEKYASVELNSHSFTRNLLYIKKIKIDNLIIIIFIFDFFRFSDQLEMANTTEATSNITNGSNNTENKPSKIIKIQSNDGKIFKLDEDVIEQSSTIKELLASMLIYLENLI
jgi:hypothetical protein